MAGGTTCQLPVLPLVNYTTQTFGVPETFVICGFITLAFIRLHITTALYTMSNQFKYS